MRAEDNAMKLTKKQHQIIRHARRARPAAWLLWAPAVLSWTGPAFTLPSAQAGNLMPLAASLLAASGLSTMAALLSQQQAQLELIGTLRDALDRGERIEPEDRTPVLNLA